MIGSIRKKLILGVLKMKIVSSLSSLSARVRLFSQCLALLILQSAWSGSLLLAGEESSILKIELRGEKKILDKSIDDAQLICTPGKSFKGKEKDLSETLHQLGLNIQFSSDCKTVKVSSENSLQTFTPESQTQAVVLTFPFEIELEGASSLSFEVVSQTVKIPSHWSSQNLGISSRLGEKPTFINQGLVQVTQLRLGDLFHPLARVQNEGSGSIAAREISGVVSEFKNSGQIESQKTLKLFGKTFQNSSGTVQATEEMTLNFETLQNQKGGLFGSQMTTLHISGSLDNKDDGIIGSTSSTTELDFGSTGWATHLGTVHGSEVHFTLNHSSPVELSSGFIQAQSSVSVFSPVKVFLPSVSIQTPLLNLSVPDFQIEPLMECRTTVIHCHPQKQFCLTSDFTSQGEIRFLESEYCRTQTKFEKKERDPQESESSANSDLGSQASQALVSLRTQEHHTDQLITQTTRELLEKSKEMEVLFQKDQATHSRYPVDIESQLVAEQGIHMLLPQGRIILGRDSQGKETGIYTSTLLMRANYFQQVSGTVSAEKALLSAPSGVDLGFLEKDETEKVKVGNQEFPLYRRGKAF
jgi:adhesin HecA-like repeat protein